MWTKSLLPAPLAGLLSLVLGCVGVTQAQTAPPPPPVVTPMVGVGFDQTFQLNVVTFNPCLLQIAINNSEGQP